MADIFSKKKRSQVMSCIRSQRNKTTELCLASIFRGFRIRSWRRRQKIEGNPDFVFPNARVAVFVDGCFCMAARDVTNVLHLTSLTGTKSSAAIERAMYGLTAN